MTGVLLGWMWIETVIAIWLWFSYRHYRKACREAETALQAHRIAAAKDRAALMKEHWAAQTASIEHYTERLTQIVEGLSTRNDQEDPTERKTA